MERMARTYGVTPVRSRSSHRAFCSGAESCMCLLSLVVQHATLVSPPQCAATSARVVALASALKGETQSAWAAEAVRRGVAHARGGDLEAALRCYAQALELVPEHRDAHVARGAALANCGRLAEGREACEAALRLDPSDRNAQQYLDAIVAKLAAQQAQVPMPMPNTAETVATQTAAPPLPAAQAIAPRAIEPPGPVAPLAAAAPAPARAGEPAVAALNDALRAAADKLRRKRKHSRKHDSAKKKSKKVRMPAIRRPLLPACPPPAGARWTWMS